MATFTQAALNADTAEALGRRREAEASVYRHRAATDQFDKDSYKGPFEKASQEAADMDRRATEMRPSGAQDPEGTTYPMADRRGNFAETADIANQGGIGIFDSNTRVLEEGEGTPNGRLNPEVSGRTAWAPSVEENNAADFMPEGDGEASQEEQEEVELERLRVNLGGQALVRPVGSSEDQPKRARGRPAKAPKTVTE